MKRPSPRNSPEHRAEIEAIRERFLHEQPDIDDLVDSGEIDEPVPMGLFVELMTLVGKIKAQRELLGLSLTDVAERPG